MYLNISKKLVVLENIKVDFKITHIKQIRHIKEIYGESDKYILYMYIYTPHKNSRILPAKTCFKSSHGYFGNRNEASRLKCFLRLVKHARLRDVAIGIRQNVIECRYM